MSINVSAADATKGGTTRVYPLTDFRDYPGSLDHRQDIVQVAAQYPGNGLTDEQKLTAKLAESVVAIVEKENLEPLRPREQVNQQNQSRYWRVIAPETLETALRKGMQQQMIELGNRIDLTLKNQNNPIKGDILARIQTLIALPNNFQIDIKPSLKDQPYLSAASGCMISPDHVLTCGHLDTYKTATRFLDDPSKYRVLFYYRALDVRNQQELPAWQVRDIESIQVLPWNVGESERDRARSGRYDVCILKLAKPVVEWPPNVIPPKPTPLAMSEYRPFFDIPDEEYGLQIGCIGCPLGGPLKWTKGDFIRTPEGEDMFFRNRLFGSTRFDIPMFMGALEVFPGNSGSPVFYITRKGEITLRGVLSFTAYDNEILPVPEVVKLVHGLLTPNQQIIIPISDLIDLFYNEDFRFCVNEDRKSGTFDKIPMKLLEGRYNDFGAWSCRIDPLKYFTQSFNEFQVVKPTETDKLKKCALVSITTGFAKLRAITGELKAPTFSFFGSKDNIMPKWISEEDGWMTQIARFGGNDADMYDFRKILGEKAGIPLNAGGLWFYDFNTVPNSLTTLGNIGGPGAQAPGMLTFCQPGAFILGDIYKKQFARGRMVVAYKISMKDQRTGFWEDEVFVFVGDIEKDDIGAHVGRWTGPLTRLGHVPPIDDSKLVVKDPSSLAKLFGQ